MVYSMDAHDGSLKQKLERIERDAIAAALQDNRWVMARAAKQLGITERMIGYKIRKYGIRRGGDGDEGGMDEDETHS